MPYTSELNSGIPYSRKLSREKTFANFAVLWLYTKVFSVKIVFLPIHESFLSRKFTAIRYMYIHCTCMCAAYGQYVGGLTTCVHVLQNSSVSSCFATCSEHRYHEYFPKRTETIGRKRRQAMMQERMREGSTCGRGLH